MSILLYFLQYTKAFFDKHNTLHSFLHSLQVLDTNRLSKTSSKYNCSICTIPHYKVYPKKYCNIKFVIFNHATVVAHIIPIAAIVTITNINIPIIVPSIPCSFSNLINPFNNSFICISSLNFTYKWYILLLAR